MKVTVDKCTHFIIRDEITKQILFIAPTNRFKIEFMDGEELIDELKF